MKRLTCGYGIDIEKAQADGQITTEDADELRHFAAFLTAVRGVPRSDPRWLEIYAEHYPEDYAAAMAAQQNTTQKETHP